MQILKKRSIIYYTLAEQAKLKLIGFDLNNGNSEYHRWPVVKKTRKNRVFNNNLIDLIPYNKLLKLSTQIKEKELNKEGSKDIINKLS